MAPPPSILRGGGIPPSTFSHVLGLVRGSYLPPVRALSLLSAGAASGSSRGSDRRNGNGGSKIFNRSNLSSSSSSFVPSSRYASSAHAILQYDPPPIYHSVRTLDPPIAQPLQRTLPPAPRRRPHALHSMKSIKTAATFRTLFESSQATPLHLGDLKFLSEITFLFLRTGEPSTWAWLSGQLGHLVSDLADAPSHWLEIRQTAKALRAYALTELDQWEYARREVSGTDRLHESIGVKHGLRALIFGKMGNLDVAREEIRASIARWTAKGSRAYTALDMEIFERYIEVLRAQGRLEEVFGLVANKRLRDRIRQPNNARLIGTVYRALADLEDPSAALFAFLQGKTLAQGRMVASTTINALLRNRIDDALELLKSCIGAGIEFSTPEFAYFSSQLTAAGKSEELKAISTAMPESSSVRWKLLQRLHAAGDSRRREDLHATWTELNETHTPSRAETLAYAQGLAALGCPNEVRAALLPIFGDSIESDRGALRLLHAAYCESHDIDQSCQYLDKLISIRPSIADFNRTLAVLAAHADVPFTVELFDSISNHGIKPDRASFTTLISLFANRRDQENAQNVFDAMVDAGFEPDHVAHAALLNAYVEAGDWEGAATRYDEMSPDFRANSSVATTVIKALVLLASPTDRILRIFRGMRNPNRYVWALVIQSAADNGDLKLTRALYEEMEAAARGSRDAPRPGVHIFSILLHAYLRAGYSESSKEVYDEMLRQGIVPTSVTYGMVVASFARLSESRSIVQAQEFAEDIYKQSKRHRALEAAGSRGSVEENIFGPLLMASAKEGDVESALQYFSQATATAETIPTYSKLMETYRRSGNADSVLEVWKKVLALAIEETSHRISSAASFSRTKRNENIICIPLSIALDALSAAGRYFDIKQIWADTEAAGFGFDSQNYNHYAIALARTGDIESAFSVVDKIIMPKWEEIRTRRVAALREQSASRHSINASLVRDPDEHGHTETEQELELRGEDVPPAFRPPNRRHENRWGDAEVGGSSSSAGTLMLLQKWRPSDALWRPSKLTMSVLELAYRQLEEAKRRTMWMALPADRDGEDDALDVEGEGVGCGEPITFPSFNNVPLRDNEGKPRKESAGMMLVKLNRRYLRVVGLIGLHRRKQRAREAMERRGR